MNTTTTVESSTRMPAQSRKIAGILGLSFSEYAQLNHSGLRAIAGLDGRPIRYYMMISPLNQNTVLEKLRHKMDKARIVYFTADSLNSMELPAEVPYD